MIVANIVQQTVNNISVTRCNLCYFTC